MQDVGSGPSQAAWRREKAPVPVTQTPWAGEARTVAANTYMALCVYTVPNTLSISAHSSFQTTQKVESRNRLKGQFKNLPEGKGGRNVALEMRQHECTCAFFYFFFTTYSQVPSAVSGKEGLEVSKHVPPACLPGRYAFNLQAHKYSVIKKPCPEAGVDRKPT